MTQKVETDHEHAWKQHDPEHKHRYRCVVCNILGYRFPRHKTWTVFTCSHTTMQEQPDGRICRRSACNALATEWHDAPYCLEHKPIPRGMGEELERLAMASRERRRASLAFAKSMIPLAVQRPPESRVKLVQSWLAEQGLDPVPEDILVPMLQRRRRDPVPSMDSKPATETDIANLPPAIMLL